MHARLWLVLACGALAGLVWWLAGGERGLGRVAVQARDAAARAAPAEAELGALAAPGLDEPAGSRAAPVAEREPSQPAAEGSARKAASVVVRVQLALASQETRSFVGWTVELQSWLENTNETFLHASRANAAGLAEFVFPGFVHVDWLRCVPPPESGLALGVSEHHENLEPGERMDETLELEPGGVLAARVVDLAGAPVAGARVHAYSEDYSWDIADWQPGLVQVVSGADGRVEMPPLPPGEWSLVVEPEDWLQLAPLPSDESAGRTVEVGERVEGPELRVCPLEHVRLTVLDAAGRPVAAAQVELAPLELGVEGLVARGSDEPDRLALFLGRAELPRVDQGTLVWPHDELYWTTDARGEARIHGVRGRWALAVSPELGTGVGSDEPVRSEIELPGPARTLRLPAAMAELRGRVVDAAGRGLAGIKAAAIRGDDDWSTGAISAGDGSFVLSGLPPGIEYALHLSDAEHLPLRTLVSVTTDTDAGTFELRPGGSLHVCLVDQDGAALSQKSLTILARRPREPLRPAEAAWFAKRQVDSRMTNQAGRAEFTRLPPGEVELALKLPSLAPDAAGRTSITMVEFQRWVVPVGPASSTRGSEEVRLVADLSGYVAPKAQAQPQHTGVVVDARTGAPIAGAWVCLRKGSSLQRRRTDSAGLFHVTTAPSLYAIQVLASGYLPLEEPERDWPPGLHEHRFALFPGGSELVVEFQDEDGVRLPFVDIAVTDPAGKPLLALARAGGELFPVLGQRISTDGSLTLSAFSSGRLHFELTLEGRPLGSAEVDPALASGAASVRLERSLAELRAALEAETEEE